MSRARRGRRATLAVGLLAVLLYPAPPAGAHASLVRSTPAHRAVLGQMPERTVSVWNEAGAQVDARDVAVGPDDPRRLSVTVETRQSGLYTVKYRVLSVDGHIVDSRFTFTVKASR